MEAEQSRRLCHTKISTAAAAMIDQFSLAGCTARVWSLDVATLEVQECRLLSIPAGLACSPTMQTALLAWIVCRKLILLEDLLKTKYHAVLLCTIEYYTKKHMGADLKQILPPQATF